MKLKHLLSGLMIMLLLFISNTTSAQTTATIGSGSSSSSSRGPIHRSDTASNTVFSRFLQIYTPVELAAEGVVSGASINSLAWELASSNTIIGTGDATWKIYIKNSSATTAPTNELWADVVSSSTLVVDTIFNTTNNFPGANGWMPFDFDAPFIYTGGALEIAVDWDCSNVTTPIFNGNGAIKWRWESTGLDTLVAKKLAEPPVAPDTLYDRKTERANIQITFTSACDVPTALWATTTSTTADLNWAAASGATGYNWKVVADGAGSAGAAISSGSTAMLNATATGLVALTEYDFFVQTDCGGGTLSAFAGPFDFMTRSLTEDTVQLGLGGSGSSTRGPFQRSDTLSSSQYSRNNMVYTAAELMAIGLPSGATITSLNFEKSNSNIINQMGDANLKIYIRESAVTAATSDSWSNLISGSTQVFDKDYNTTNNFPASSGWMPFELQKGFVYNGGALEIGVDWDDSDIPAPKFSGNGAVTWRYNNTGHVSIAQRTGSSSAPTTISTLKSQRANIEIVYYVPACDEPTALWATTTSTTADLNWAAASGATGYNWKVVADGAGSAGVAISSGSTAMLNATATGLVALTEYDFFVQTDCGGGTLSAFAGPFDFMTRSLTEDTVQLGLGGSGSSTRGPFQRSDTMSSSQYSRNNMVYTAAELMAIGLPSGATITSLNFEKSNSNIINQMGDANLKIYIRESAVTAATSDSWSNLISGSTQVFDKDYNTTNNFPASSGWMPFELQKGFVYNGGALEIGVDWDDSDIPAPKFSGNGAVTWRYNNTGHVSIAQRTGSSSAPTTISTLKSQRANIEIVYYVPACDEPTALWATTTSTTADLNWAAASGATGYNWKVVADGAGSAGVAISSGSTAMLNATATGLVALTEYDFFVQTDCGGGTLSAFAGPFDFMTRSLTEDTVQLGLGGSGSSTRGPFQRSDTMSSSQYSRNNMVYTAAELMAIGLPSGATITSLNFEKSNSNIINQMGDANLKIYIRESAVTAATSDSWSNLISGSTQVFDKDYNTTNNFPASSGWMPFELQKGFVYNGGALEIGVDWDDSDIPAPKFSGNGAVTWRYNNTGHVSIAQRTGSGSAPTTISTLKSQRANIEIVYHVPVNTWTGNISTDFNIAGNWSANTIPSSTDNIVIPTTPTGGLFPTTTVDLTVENLVVETGASLTIGPGLGLIIAANGEVDNDGSIILASDAVGTAWLDDFTNTTTTYTGDITTQQFIQNGVALGQRFFGSPVNNGVAGGLDLTYTTYPLGQVIPDPSVPCSHELDASSPYSNLFDYNETGPYSAGCAVEVWYAIDDATVLQNGKSYSGWFQDGSILEFTGEPNSGAISYNATSVTAGAPADAMGWHMLSNPYPSLMSINAVFDDGFTSPMYYDGASGAFGGTYQPALTMGQTVPIAQGFVAQTGGNPFTPDNTYRSTGSSTFKSGGINGQMKLVIDVSGNGFKDVTNIWYDQNATMFFDDYFDCVKRKSDIGQPTIFTGSSSSPLALNVMSDNDFGTSVPLGMFPGANGEFTFSFSGLETLPSTVLIFLEDKVNNTWTEINTSEEYVFNMTETEGADRFEIHFTNPIEVDAISETCEGNDGKININFGSSSINGSIVQWSYLLNNENIEISSGTSGNIEDITDLSPGLYEITFNSQGGSSIIQSIEIDDLAQVDASFIVNDFSIYVGESIDFLNNSEGALDYEWSIENISYYDENISYDFTEAGEFEISLIASNDNCSDKVIQTVTVANKVSAIDELGVFDDVKVYTTNGQLIIDLTNAELELNTDIEIYDFIGQLILDKLDVNDKETIDINQFENGYYIVRLINGNSVKSKKIFYSNN